MSVLRTGVHGIDCHGVIPVTYMGTGALGLPPLDFDEAACTFTAGMAKRDTSGNVFAASPIVQGDWDGAGTPDILSLPRGALISGSWYGNFDPYQGSIVFWITPEWDGNDGLTRFIFSGLAATIRIRKFGNILDFVIGPVVVTVDIAAWTAGTRYCVIVRWDIKNTLDGTNYGCISINGAHNFGDTAGGAVATPDATMHIGSREDTSVLSADAIIEGFTVYRRPLWDGAYGVDVGNGDEVALISAGVDPCTVTGSWDVVFCLPTNAAVGALVTGTGEAWSHPHAAAETNLTDAYCQTAYAASAWADEGTPVTPAAYDFDALNTVINCGSNAALDNLPSQPAGKGTFTAEAWVRMDGWGEGGAGFVFSKYSPGNVGWLLYVTSTGIFARIYCATTNGESRGDPTNLSPDGRLHHIAMTWDDATYTFPRIWVDGFEVTYIATQARNGAVVLDAAVNFYLGSISTGTFTWDGKIAWSRLSNNIRYSSPFVPPPLTNPPAVDGNTVEQWNMQDCAGASATAQVNAGAPPGGCDGQITAGAGGWNCLKDMDDFAIGDRDFQWGYIFGSDAANEGITQTAPGAPLTAGQNYALRVPVNLGADSNGRARIRVRDMTNAANIVDFDGPLMTGAHTGANNSATLIVAGARFPQSLIGAEVYNITDVNVAGTDCSHAAITAVSGDGTTVTAALAGGTDNDWDTNDVFRIVWHRTGAGVRSMPADHPWTETFCFELPTNARHGVGADCVSISVKVLNALASGTVMVHQVELQENELDNPSLEVAYAGVPPIPLGWTNFALDAGDTQAELVTIHSGAQSMEWNPGAVSNEGIQQTLGLADQSFLCFGGWLYAATGEQLILRTTTTTAGLIQYSTTVFWQLMTGIGAWDHHVAVFRQIGANRSWQIFSIAGAVNDRFLDDVYLFRLDDVTLTAVAANQADSEE